MLPKDEKLLSKYLDLVPHSHWTMIYVNQYREFLTGDPPDDFIKNKVRDLVPKLFGPFFTTKKVGDGAGLRLSMVKGILDEHKVTISIIEDCPNTCFEITFLKPRISDVA
jgi:hypothetical protein